MPTSTASPPDQSPLIPLWQRGNEEKCRGASPLCTPHILSFLHRRHCDLFQAEVDTLRSMVLLSKTTLKHIWTEP